MALITPSLATTTGDDWQPGLRQGNPAIAALARQSNWALASAGAWQWQHTARITAANQIAVGSTWWPVVCAPMFGVRLRVSLYGACSSGGSDQIGIYLSDSWPFGAGIQIGTLTLGASPGLVYADCDVQAYRGPVLIYLKAETTIDDPELEGFRGRLVATSDPDATALALTITDHSRYIQEGEIADTAPLTWLIPQACLDVAYACYFGRGRALLHLSPIGGQVRYDNKFTQVESGAQVLAWQVPCQGSVDHWIYIRSHQRATGGSDYLQLRANGQILDCTIATTGAQTQEAYEGWERFDFSGIVFNNYFNLDLIYVSTDTADDGHIIQDISVLAKGA